MVQNEKSYLKVEETTIKDDETSIRDDHRHSFHELYLLLDGHARCFINNEIYNVEAGEIAFVWQGYIHKMTYNRKQRSRRLLVYFTTAFIGDEYLPMLRVLKNQRHLRLLPEAFEYVKSLFYAMRGEYSKKEDYHLLQCQNLLRQIIICLCRQPELQRQTDVGQNEKIVQDAAQFVSVHYAEPLSLGDLARKFSMSDSHFSRTFKEYTGIGVAQYIKLTRLRAAEKLLLNKTGSITDIALACGFNNSNYFICDFKKHYGITPLQFAINMRKG